MARTDGQKKNRFYDCPCGKKHKSRTTVLKHKRKIEQENQNSGENEQSSTSKSTAKIIEINLKPEFDKLTETINPKNKEGEKKYDCGKCAGEFTDKQKFCPHCGCEFE